MEISSSNLVHT